jgi:hypothetical protein
MLHHPRFRQFGKMEDHSHLMFEQRAKVVVLSAEMKTITTTQWRFLTRWAPARNIIRRSFKKISKGTRGLDESTCALQLCSLSKLWKRSPSKSTKKAAPECRKSWHSVQRILQKGLRMLPYKIAVVNKLFDRVKERWFQFPAWVAGNNEILFNIQFSDEVCFQSDGTVSKWAMRFWGTGPPESFHEKSSHKGQVTVWVAKPSHSLLGPIFLHETVNSEWYLHMLQNNFLPPFMANGLPLHTQCFMQTLPYMWTLFWPSHHVELLSRSAQLQNFWPHVSPDLNPCDFFLWGFLKAFPQKPFNTILDDRNACWVVQRGWERLVSPCHFKSVTIFKRLLKETVATSSTYWYNKYLCRCEGTMYEVESEHTFLQ